MEDQGFARPLLAGDQPWLSVPCLEIPTFTWGIINIILEKKTHVMVILLDIMGK